MDYLDHLRSDSARFSTVLRDVDPGTRVPTCPDWDAADLVWHLAEVQWFWAAIVRGRLASPEDIPERPARPSGYPELLSFGERCSAELVEVLAATPPDTVHWTWSTDNTTGFVVRRMAQEALVHRLDAELTAGAPTDLDPDLAADGVSEAFEHFFGGWPEWATFAMDGPVGALHADDLDRTWLVQTGRFTGTAPSGNAYTDEGCIQLVEAGVPVYTVTASVRDLEAWVWHRPTLAPVRVEGDDTAYRQLAAVVEAGID